MMDPRRTRGIPIKAWFKLSDHFGHENLGFVNECPVEGMFYAARFYLSAKRLSIAEAVSSRCQST